MNHSPSPREYTPNAEGYIVIGPVDDIPVGATRTLRAGNVTIALFHTRSGFYAVKDACPHAESPLSRGAVDDQGIVTCPGHAWRFDLATGQCQRGNTTISLRTFVVEIRAQQIWIKTPL